MHTNQGPKEEVYGFYPKGIGKSILKGPGMLRSEFQCGHDDDCSPGHNNLLKRFSEGKESVTIPIDSKQRQIILQQVNQWDNGTYKFLDHNYIDLVGAVVARIDFQPPERRRTQTPIQYVQALKRNVDRELARRRRQKEDELYQREA
jgi:hypothetical protein